MFFHWGFFLFPPLPRSFSLLLSIACISSHPLLGCTKFIPDRLEASHRILGQVLFLRGLAVWEDNTSKAEEICFLVFHFHSQDGVLIFCQLMTADEKILWGKKETPCQHVEHPRRMWEQEGRWLPLAPGGGQGSVFRGSWSMIDPFRDLLVGPSMDFSTPLNC